MKKVVVVFFMFLYFKISVAQPVKISVAQPDCSSFVEKATELYNQGKYDECTSLIEGTLKDCPSIMISKSTKEKAYVLLINCYIEKDSIPAVESNFKKLLKNNPAFKIKDYSGVDDFKIYHNSYYTLPRLTVGARLYYSKNKMGVKKEGEYSIKTNVQNNTVYAVDNNYGFSVTGELRPFNKIGLFADYGIWNLDYRRNINNSQWSLFYKEKVRYMHLDLGAKYYLNYKQKLNAYLSGGFNNLFILNSELDVSVKETIVSSIDYNNNLSSQIVEKGRLGFDSKKLRAPLVLSLYCGAGFIYRIGKTGIGLDYRSIFIGSSINSKKNRFEEPSLIETYGYVDNDTFLKRKIISLTFVYMFNQVRQKEKK
ncbi:MAG: hypothetical protein WBM13_03730 [Bacteroidia bacterium]